MNDQESADPGPVEELYNTLNYLRVRYFISEVSAQGIEFIDFDEVAEHVRQITPDATVPGNPNLYCMQLDATESPLGTPTEFYFGKAIGADMFFYRSLWNGIEHLGNDVAGIRVEEGVEVLDTGHTVLATLRRAILTDIILDISEFLPRGLRDAMSVIRSLE